MPLHLLLITSVLGKHLGCNASLQGGSRQKSLAESGVLVLVDGCCAALITGMAPKDCTVLLVPSTPARD